MMDLTGSTAGDFQRILKDASEAFLNLDAGTQFEVFVLTGSDSNIGRIDDGIVPDDALSSTGRNRQAIVDDLTGHATALFRKECPASESDGTIRCKHGRSCLLRSLRDRLRSPAGRTDTRPLTILYFTDGMEDCEHPIGQASQRIDLLRFDRPEQAVALIAQSLTLEPLDEFQKLQATKTNLYFCLPRKLLQNGPHGKTAEWLDRFWRPTFSKAGVAWKYFGLDDSLPSKLPE